MSLRTHIYALRGEKPDFNSKDLAPLVIPKASASLPSAQDASPSSATTTDTDIGELPRLFRLKPELCVAVSLYRPGTPSSAGSSSGPAGGGAEVVGVSVRWPPMRYPYTAELVTHADPFVTWSGRRRHGVIGQAVKAEAGGRTPAGKGGVIAEQCGEKGYCGVFQRGEADWVDGLVAAMDGDEYASLIFDKQNKQAITAAVNKLP